MIRSWSLSTPTFLWREASLQHLLEIYFHGFYLTMVTANDGELMGKQLLLTMAAQTNRLKNCLPTPWQRSENYSHLMSKKHIKAYKNILKGLKIQQLSLLRTQSGTSLFEDSIHSSGSFINSRFSTLTFGTPSRRVAKVEGKLQTMQQHCCDL